MYNYNKWFYCLCSLSLDNNNRFVLQIVNSFMLINNIRVDMSAVRHVRLLCLRMFVSLGLKSNCVFECFFFEGGNGHLRLLFTHTNNTCLFVVVVFFSTGCSL